MDNRIERTWEHDGHACAVTLHPVLLHRCGYVLVSPDSPLSGVGYNDERILGIDVHGGVTFADNMDVDGDVRWAFGFDCGHYSDKPDLEAGIERYGDNEGYHSPLFESMLRDESAFGMYRHMWTLDDCVEETERMCDQVSVLEREHTRG